MPLVTEENFAEVAAYFRRMLLEPVRAGRILVVQEALADARAVLERCRDGPSLNAWLAVYVRPEAVLRCRNALYQKKCSRDLQRLSLKRELYRRLAAFARSRHFTINQAVEHLLGLAQAAAAGSEAGSPKVQGPVRGQAELDWHEQMLVWSMSRASGVKDDD